MTPTEPGTHLVPGSGELESGECRTMVSHQHTESNELVKRECAFTPSESAEDERFLKGNHAVGRVTDEEEGERKNPGKVAPNIDIACDTYHF